MPNNYLNILDHMEHMTEDQLKGNVTIMKIQAYEIDEKKRVFVYFNLHRKVWSVRQSGKVVGHTEHIMLKDCRFLVGKKGRERVIREGKKNVHAGVSGYIVDNVPLGRSSQELTYNPYKYEGFVSCIEPDEGIIDHSNYAVLSCGNGWRDVEAIWLGE